MIISQLNKYLKDGRAGISAVIRWENRVQDDQLIYFEVEAQHEGYLNDGAEPFIVAAAVPAFFAGEKRIRIDGDVKVSGSLIQNIQLALRLLKSWYKLHDLYVPEFKAILTFEHQEKKERTASFLSGGVDSLYTLKKNHDTYPAGHPKRIVDAILIYGFDIGFYKGKDNYALFEMAYKANKKIAEDANVNLISVFTNLRLLSFQKVDWLYHYHGVAMASIAHSLNAIATTFLYGSSDDIDRLVPKGSDPYLMSLFSDDYISLICSGLEVNRQGKISYIKDWDIALQQIRVCWQDTSDLNCGICEKCIRTKLGIHAVGVKINNLPFKYNGLHKSDLLNLNLKGDIIIRFKEILPYLNGELKSALEEVLKRSRKEEKRKKTMSTIRHKLVRTDEILFNSNLIKIKRKLAGS